MAAVSEMPLPVQEVVRARLSDNRSVEELGEPLGLTGEEVTELLQQGQAILDRALGRGFFTIRYIDAEVSAAEAENEPVFPDIDDEEDEDGYESPRATELGQMIARSVDALAERAAAEGPGQEEAREVLSEALRDVGQLFRLAAERLGAVSGPSTPPNLPLRNELARSPGEPDAITVIVDGPTDIAGLLMAIQSASSVQWARLESFTPERAVFRLMIRSVMDLVRDLMSLEGNLRPTRLQMSGAEITIQLGQMGTDSAATPQVASAEPPTSQPTATAPADTAPRPAGRQAVGGQHVSELAVDSFFGARHFIESGGGKVGPPHHHSYRVEAGFVSARQTPHGFVLGFANVRQLVESTLMRYSETLLNTEEPFRQIPPTTENLARVFHQQIAEKLSALNQPDVLLKHVRVWESPTNSATYTDVAITA